MIVVNIVGGPGIGKSAVAAGVYHRLRTQGRSAELIIEFAKELTWEGRHDTLANQIYVFGEQLNRLWRVRNSVDLAITDTSLLFALVYGSKDLPKTFAPLVIDTFNIFDNMVFVLDRGVAFESSGRYQTEEEAIKVDARIIEVLDELKIPYMRVGHPSTAINRILKAIDERMDGKRQIVAA